MKHKKTLLCSLLLISCLILVTSMPVFAAELTEAEVQQAVDAQGKETVTGNVFIWFLCAIAFLKVSQKIDSFMEAVHRLPAELQTGGQKSRCHKD